MKIRVLVADERWLRMARRCLRELDGPIEHLPDSPLTGNLDEFIQELRLQAPDLILADGAAAQALDTARIARCFQVETWVFYDDRNGRDHIDFHRFRCTHRREDVDQELLLAMLGACLRRREFAAGGAV